VTAKINANRQKKADKIAYVQDTVIGNSEIVIVTVNNGLNAAAAVDLRNKVRAVGAVHRVEKNTLVKRALTGSAFAGIDSMLTGPTALTTCADPVAAAKVIVEFAKGNEKLQIIGAGFGAQILDAAGVKNLASLPSLNELRGKIVGLLQAPATKIAGVLQAPAGQLARVMAAKAKEAA